MRRAAAASRTPTAEDPSAQMAYRWAAQAHSWPGGGWFPVLDAVVVVQQARLVGAGPAVTSVEPARWMVMVDQHGCSSRSTATAPLKRLWSMAMTAMAFSFVPPA